MKILLLSVYEVYQKEYLKRKKLLVFSTGVAV